MAAADSGAGRTRPRWTASDDTSRVAYEVLSRRREAYDTLIWQSPALSLTAQAFLLTIALGPQSSELARAAAAVLGMIVNLMTIQLMYKNRFEETLDSILIHEFELDHNLLPLHAPVAPRSTKPVDEQEAWELSRVDYVNRFRKAHGLAPLEPNWLQRRKSFTVWISGLAVFIGVDAAILGLALWKVALFR